MSTKVARISIYTCTIRRGHEAYTCTRLISLGSNMGKLHPDGDSCTKCKQKIARKPLLQKRGHKENTVGVCTDVWSATAATVKQYSDKDTYIKRGEAMHATSVFHKMSVCILMYGRMTCISTLKGYVWRIGEVVGS